MTISYEMQILAGVLVALGAYFIGNINSAILICKIKGVDIRKMGSGNPGTMNMLRSVGKIAGVVTLILDVLKGVIPCLLGWLFVGNGQFLRLGSDRLGMYIAGFCAVLGHIYPVCMKFHGGKGAATILGVCLTMRPVITLLCFGIGVAFLFITRVGSLTSFLMFGVPIMMEGFRAVAMSQSVWCCVILFAMYSLSLFAHRKNLFKLFSGGEGRVNITKKAKNKRYPVSEIVFDPLLICE